MREYLAIPQLSKKRVRQECDLFRSVEVGEGDVKGDRSVVVCGRHSHVLICNVGDAALLLLEEKVLLAPLYNT